MHQWLAAMYVAQRIIPTGMYELRRLRGHAYRPVDQDLSDRKRDFHPALPGLFRHPAPLANPRYYSLH
ncbi:MAG: hypothetical protein ABI865_06255 [Nitrosospira sp.]